MLLVLFLSYRASEDSERNSFYSQCAHLKETLVICKSVEGAIFGGYTNLPWNINCMRFYSKRYAIDNNQKSSSFLFYFNKGQSCCFKRDKNSCELRQHFQSHPYFCTSNSNTFIISMINNKLYAYFEKNSKKDDYDQSIENNLYQFYHDIGLDGNNNRCELVDYEVFTPDLFNETFMILKYEIANFLKVSSYLCCSLRDIHIKEEAIKRGMEHVKDIYEKKQKSKHRNTKAYAQKVVFANSVQYFFPVHILQKYPTSLLYKCFVRKKDRCDSIFIPYAINNANLVLQYMSHTLPPLSENLSQFLIQDLIGLQIPLSEQEFGHLYNNDVPQTRALKEEVVSSFLDHSFSLPLITKHMNIRLQDLQYCKEKERYILSIPPSCKEGFYSWYNIIQQKRDDDIDNENIKRKLLSIECFYQHYQPFPLTNENKEFALYRNSISLQLSRFSLTREQCDEIATWTKDIIRWELIYRASEHEYTAESFHKYCDDQGPTLVIIKSSDGWIFGGFTTQSWSGNGILSQFSFIL